jgi:hypothetical protein
MAHFLQSRVNGLLRRMLTHAASVPCNHIRSLAIKNCNDDKEALELSGMFANVHLRAAEDHHKRHPFCEGYPKGYIEDHWVRQVAELYDADNADTQLCLKITKQAIEEFAGARMSSEIEDLAAKELASLSLVYVDINDGNLKISDSVSVHVRMVFIETENGRESYNAVLELPGAELRLVKWQVENGQAAHFRFDHFHRDDDTLAVIFRMRALNLMPLRDRLIQLDVDIAKMAKTVIRLCRLSVVWLSTQPPMIDPLPVHPTFNAGGNRTKSRRKPKTNGLNELIRFREVQPPCQRFQQGAHTHAATPDGHEAERYRVWVTGHYRWQPWGKGRANRKVIWVHEFLRGPEDAPIRVRARVVNPKPENTPAQGN